MSEPWYECISDELAEVDATMDRVLVSDNEELTEMCRYVISSGGKRIRPALCVLSHYAVGGKDFRRSVEMGSAFEIIHSATLVHDDINDKGELRRGRKSLYRVYTIGKAIVTGDIMFAMGFRLIGATAPEIVDYIVDASAAMGAGEFVQKEFEHKSEVTPDDYFEIIEGKTAKIFSASAKSGAFLADTDMEMVDALGDYALALGKVFQIVDDVLDVTGNSDNTGKTVGLDLIEGKPTLPVIFAMEDPVYGEKIKEIFETDEPDQSSVDRAIELILKTDSVERCMKVASDMMEEAYGYLEILEDSVYKRALLNLGEFVIDRDR